MAQCETDDGNEATFAVSLIDSLPTDSTAYMCTLCVQEMSMTEDMKEYNVQRLETTP